MDYGQRTTALNGTRILVVEDEYYLATDLASALKEAGAEVVGPIGTLPEAHAAVAKGGFDYAVVDINLRGSFTYTVVEKLDDLGVPFVIASGYDRATMPATLQHAPRVDKPFSSAEVIGRIMNMRADRC